MIKYAKAVQPYNGLDGISEPLQKVLDEVMERKGEILPGFPKIVETNKEKDTSWEIAKGFVIAVYQYEDFGGVEGFPDVLE